MTKSNLELWLQPTLLEEARRRAQAEGVASDQLVDAALEEKLSTSRRAEHFGEWTAPANVPSTLRILARTDAGRLPMIGDPSFAKGKGLKLHWRKT